MQNINPIYLLVFFFSLILSLILTPLVGKIAKKFGILDQPETADRKIHQKPIPLLGGLAIFLSLAIIMFSVWFFQLADFARVPTKFLAFIFLGGLLIMIGGLLDDKYRLKPWQQIIWPLLAALLVLLAGIKIAFITNPIGGSSSAIIYLTPLIGLLISFCWLFGMMYTTKLLDGLDGLVTGITAIAAFMIFILSLDWDLNMSATGVWAIALLGASLGFLVFNFQPAKIFLGEGGSIFMGFMLGVLSIISGSKIATTLLVVGIPVLDVLWVMIRRIARGESPFSHADRKHLHFQLLDAGFTHREAVLFIYLSAIVFGFLAVLSNSIGKIYALIGLVLTMALIVLFIYLKAKKHAVVK